MRWRFFVLTSVLRRREVRYDRFTLPFSTNAALSVTGLLSNTIVCCLGGNTGQSRARSRRHAVRANGFGEFIKP